MSRPPPPPTFPTPNLNVRSSTYPPPQPGPVYPPQQSATYATSQPLQPPSAHRDRDPYPVDTHASSSAYPYSSSQPYPYPSAHLPSEPPQTPSYNTIPSVPGYGTSTSFSGAPPPPMMQRVMTMPTPGQGYNPVPYHNAPAQMIGHQPAYPGMSGGTRSVTGDWSHHDHSYAHNEEFVQRSEDADSSSNLGLTKGPPNKPGAGKPAPCKHCGRMTPRTTYDSLGGFCKEKHRNEWNATHNQNQNQYNQNLVQHPEAAGGSSNLGLTKGPPSGPGAGRTDIACKHCGRMTPRMTYDSLGGFCKEKHRNEWYAKHNQNQYQYNQNQHQYPGGY